MLSFTPSSDQFLRKWSLVVYGAQGGQALELTAGVGQPGQNSGAGFESTTNPQGQPLSEGLRMKFRTVAADVGVPNHAEVTVYNLKNETANRVMRKEFSRVVLQAGYVNGHFGVIFDGTLKQVKRGRESAVDSYLIMYISDGDFFCNQYAIPDPIYMPRDSSKEDRARAQIADATKNGGVTAGPIEGLSGGILPRTTVLYGMGNHNMDTTSRPYAQWSIQNGVIQTRPINGYLKGEAVVLNSATGLIGQPEVNDMGVFATALLNPAVKVGGLAKINNGDVNTSEPATQQGVTVSFGFPAVFTPPAAQLFASTSEDGTYVILMIQYEGDTRGNPWYMHLGMLLQDPSTGNIVPNVLTPVGGPTSPGHL